MNSSIRARINIIRRKLYQDYVLNSPYKVYNKKHIDFVLNKVYQRQLKIYNKNEQKVINRLIEHGLEPKTQELIPVLSKGGKLDHLYIADMVVGSTIIEVDGPQHEKQKEWDEERDSLTSSLGYTTIRIPTNDLSPDTIDNYLQSLYEL